MDNIHLLFLSGRCGEGAIYRRGGGRIDGEVNEAEKKCRKSKIFS